MLALDERISRVLRNYNEGNSLQVSGDTSI